MLARHGLQSTGDQDW
uniref:Uncharacterized protein n=1 Tax=Arundo donax TaxID=35708 RepID=A0A0A8ZID8_ARUDO